MTMPQAYEPPPDTEGMTPEEAQAAVNQMNAAFVADPEHPYFNGNHAQHGDFVAYAHRLFEIIADAKVEKDEAAEAQQIRDIQQKWSTP
jgi:hypothetical protein